MMVTRVAFPLAVLTFCVGSGGVHHAYAQNVQRVQPIILTTSPDCCSSPATTANQLVALPCGDCTYLAPADRDPLRVIPASSHLQPLPTTAPCWRGRETACSAVADHPETVTLPPATTVAFPPTTTSVQVLRPTLMAPPVRAVPDGSVVGKGLIGQPKLYKPGQPVRNFLRYITL